MSFEVRVLDFASDQEPEHRADSWVALVQIQIVGDGADLARLLGVQQRVLARELRRVDSRQLLRALDNLSESQLRAIATKVHRFVRNYATEHGFQASVEDVSLTDSWDYWTVTVDARREQAIFNVEVDVLGWFE